MLSFKPAGPMWFCLTRAQWASGERELEGPEPIPIELSKSQSGRAEKLAPGASGLNGWLLEDPDELYMQMRHNLRNKVGGKGGGGLLLTTRPPSESLNRPLVLHDSNFPAPSFSVVIILIARMF